MEKKNLKDLPIEIRFVPLSKEEAKERQERLELLLLKGAIKASEK
ncbi:MAG TPA: hypothetical protein VHE12_03355 [bacterium]|nr:hypothetical protein [bacterium]